MTLYPDMPQQLGEVAATDDGRVWVLGSEGLQLVADTPTARAKVRQSVQDGGWSRRTRQGDEKDQKSD